ncbi:hypothetical protein KUH03_15080 [Sphingobacterium sp. E70]|uniref:hypothetical protein n=1 Tax=Sphingobacterium sp. E70 TaxID=2853439 RepID=UPI00211BE52F|nr:hypothetical protein [Sphingobacterium sp. E70]ULT27844.1 hypothetical protein KUH03_15080 [Sphingobacterium sp. E70]
MKKIFNSLAVLLLISSASYAQQPQNRTTATKIADVLAQQPAEEKKSSCSPCTSWKDLLPMTSLLSKGLKAPGSNNAPIEFAANSYSFMSISLEKSNKEKYLLKV